MKPDAALLEEAAGRILTAIGNVRGLFAAGLATSLYLDYDLKRSVLSFVDLLMQMTPLALSRSFIIPKTVYIIRAMKSSWFTMYLSGCGLLWFTHLLERSIMSTISNKGRRIPESWETEGYV